MRTKRSEFNETENGRAMKRFRITSKSLAADVGITIEEAAKRIDYWVALPANRQDGYIASAGMSFEDTTARDEYIMAIGSAAFESPEEAAKRIEAQKAHDNELLKCDRTGEMVARKDCVVLPSSVYSIECLTDLEKEMLA